MQNNILSLGFGILSIPAAAARMRKLPNVMRRYRIHGRLLAWLVNVQRGCYPMVCTYLLELNLRFETRDKRLTLEPECATIIVIGG